MSTRDPTGPAGPVHWSADARASSPRYGDFYTSEAGALAQARHVFLHGNGLPGRWQARTRFTVLETGFGLGLNFLATWQAWHDDPARCARLDYVAIEAHPVSPDDIARAVAAAPEQAPLVPLAQQLIARHPLPLPGLHRIEFVHADGPQAGVLVLTLAIGHAPALLRELHLSADAVYLDGFSPARNPDMWSPALLKSVARLMREGGTAASWTIAAAVRHGLAQAGFVVERAPGLPPKRDALRARYAPAWARPVGWPVHPAQERPPGEPHALVIGAGLAGAATTRALRARGWRVTVVDATGPAAGASGLPAGLMVPHVSPDDAPMSRLTRAGAALLRDWIGQDGLPARHWREAGVLQQVDDAHRARAPAAWGELGLADRLFELREARPGQPARFFPQGLAIEGGALVRHWLDAPGVTPCWGRAAASLARQGDGWAALDAQGEVIAQAPVAIVATALASLPLATPLATPGDAATAGVLRAVRGQITLGRTALPAADVPAHALSGHGHFIAALNAESPWPWLVGASFERGEATPEASSTAHAGNLDKLCQLAPALARQVEGDFDPATARAWVQVRCASPDRLPLVGPVPGRPGLHMLAALGSRGLSLTAVCAELLASQIDGDPWPVEERLARALAPARFIADPAAARPGGETSAPA
ncbi:MAG: tRNA (5-methylaminomethyl-2-thiouridine)(34)-methyltransferase MnmD [Burkholderiaceae bacterium]|nr:tRNA (5-methylaminomethyl-2-thiouridine)(34)-methyltransferase MnmD [Burkholderiaceae bacterium]